MIARRPLLHEEVSGGHRHGLEREDEVAGRLGRERPQERERGGGVLVGGRGLVEIACVARSTSARLGRELPSGRSRAWWPNERVAACGAAPRSGAPARDDEDDFVDYPARVGAEVT